MTVSESRRVDRLARLAKLSLPEVEAAKLELEIDQLIKFVDQIQRHDVKDVDTKEHYAIQQLRPDDQTNTDVNHLDLQRWEAMPKIFRVKRILG